MLKVLRNLALAALLCVPWVTQAQNTQTFNFEDNAIPANWTNDATYPWEVTNAQNHTSGGTYSIKSGNYGQHSTESEIEATFTFFSEGSISFYCWSSCESATSNWDYGVFYIDGVKQGNNFLHVTDWLFKTYAVDAGSHTFKWIFHKDGSGQGGDDCFYIDDVVVDLGEIPDCYPVLNLSLIDSMTTAESLTLSWLDTNNSNASYKIYQIDSTDTTLVTTVGDTFYTFNLLDANTAYTFGVASDCGSDGLGTMRIVSGRTACVAVTTFPWKEKFEDYDAGELAIPCWTNERIVDGTGNGSLSVFKIYTSTNGGNSTHQLQLPDMRAGTKTKLVLPLMEIPENEDYQFVIDVYRNASGSSATTEGVRVLANTTNDTTGATELAFLYRNFTQTDNNYIPTETASGWYTYELPIGMTGDVYIILLGESQYGNATYMDNLMVRKTPTCLKVTDIAVVDSLTTSSSITLTYSNEDGDDVVVINMADSSIVATSDDMFATVNNLRPNTPYTFGVYRDCGGDDYSDTMFVSGRTACGAIDSLPYTTGFEAADLQGTANASALPWCWTRINELTTTYSYYPYSYSYSTYAHTGSRSLYFNSTASGTYAEESGVILPELDVTAYPMNLNRLVFWARTSNTTNAYNVMVGTLSDAEDLTTFSLVGTVQVNSTTYAKYTVPLANADATDPYVVLLVTRTDGTSLYIDDLTLEVAPSCRDIDSLTVVDSLTTSSSLTLSWVDNANPNATYSVYVRNGDTDSLVADGIEETTYTVDELNAATTYTFAVEANCGADESSPRTTVTGTTACAAISEFPWSENFDSIATGTLNVICWQNEHISGSGTSLFTVTTTTNGNSTHQLQLPDMSGGTLTKLVLPPFEIPEDEEFLFTLDIYRSNSTYNANNIYEGVRVFASANGEIEGATEIAFVPRQYNTGNNVIPSENAVGWYTYDLLIGMTGNVYIILQGESQYCTATYMDNFVVKQAPSCWPVNSLAVDATTNESITLSWTGSADNYIIIDTANDEEYLVDTNVYTIEDLTANTLYTFGVISDCDEDGTSDTVYISARTLCDPIELPLTESFEDTSATVNCWTFDGNSAANNANMGISNNKMHFQATTYDASAASNYLQYGYSPMFNVSSSATALSVKARYATYYSSYGTYVQLYFGYKLADGTEIWEEDGHTTSGPNNYEYFTDTIPANAVQVMVKYRATSYSSSYVAYIDSVMVEEIEDELCFPVANLTVDSLSNTSVSLSWVSDGASFTIVNMETEATVATTQETSLTIDELVANTDYTFGVVVNCTSTTSDTMIVNIHTLCDAVALPYTETFETTSDNISCWTSEGQGAWTIGSGNGTVSTAYEGNTNAKIVHSTTGDVTKLISPVLALGEDVTALKLTFAHLQSQWVSDIDEHRVLYRTSAGDIWTEVADYTTAIPSWTVEEIMLPANTYQVAFEFIDGYGYGVGIDSVVFTPMTADYCFPVTDIAVDTFDASSITITWSGAANSYSLYTLSTDSTGTDTTFVASVTDTFYTFTELTAATNYIFGVRAVCGSDSADLVTINGRTDCEGGSCTITLSLADSWGDGWNGNYLAVSVGGELLGYATISSGTAAIYHVTVCKGVPVSFTYVLGGSSTYPSENSFTITDGTGEVVYTCTDASTLTSGAVCFTLEDACPTCFPVTNLAVDTIGENSVTIKWDGDADNFSVYNGTTWVDNTADTFYTFTGLTANTLYTFGVRSVCAADDSSRMVTIDARTNCGTITELPYSTGFETADLMGTTDVLALPYCWTRNTSVATSTYPRSYSGYARNGSRSLVFDGSTGITAPDTMMVALPALDVTAYPMSANRVVFWARMATASTSKNLYVGTMSDPTDRSTFVVVDSVLIDTNTYTKHSVVLTAATSPYVALMTKKVTGTIYIDDFKLEVAPDCADVEGLTIDSTDGTTVYVSWNDAQVSQYTVEARNGQTVAFTQTTSDTTLAITDLPIDNDYEIVVRSVCGAGNGNWSEPVTVHVGYCEPNPTSVDNSGITSVVFGGMTNTTSHPTSAPYYINNTNLTGSVPAGTTANVDITFATGYTYGTIIWVDWNKNLVFDGDEVVYVGTSTSTNPTTLNASFLIPATQDTGAYRMRIGAADSYFDNYVSSIAAAATANPCWSNTYSIGEDYTLVVTEAPSFTVTANVNNAQMGHIIGAPTAPVLVGTEVNLVAAAEAGYHFVNWTSGATVISTTPTLDLTVTSDTTVTANFEANPVNTYTVTANVNNAQMGHITGAPTAAVTAGTVVNMTAVPETGYRFVNWTSGATVISTTAALALTVTSDTTVTANFELMPENPQYYTVTVNYDATKGTVTGIPTEPVLEGSSVRLTAEANDGYKFAGWVIANDTVDRALSYTISNIQSNVTITAVFVEKVGINDVDMTDVKIFSANDVIYVNGAEGMSVSIFDVNGRILNQTEKAGENVEFRVAATGVYMVKVGNAAAKRVVVMR